MNRIHVIQYLRAVAALAVVALHAGKRVDDSLPESVWSVLAQGHAGVDLFFVISGFIMWTIAGQGAAEPGRFLLRRAIRVAPPYWIATLAWVVLVWLLGYEWIVVTPEHVLQSLAFMPHYNPTFPTQIWPVLVPGWTLSYEMYFYAIFAGVLLASIRLRLPVLVAALAGLVVLGVLLGLEHGHSAAAPVTYTSPLLLEFLGGCLVAALWQRFPGGAGRGIVVLVTGLSLLIWLAPGVDPDSLWSRSLGFGLPMLLIVSGALGIGATLPRLGWLERLGDASYAIYLFHLFLILPMAEIWIRLPGMHSAGTALAFVGLALIGASLLGLTLFRFMERPMQIGLNSLVQRSPGRSKLAKR